MLNFSIEKYGTTVYCDRPTERFFPASRLILSDATLYRDHGMLCPPVVRPPVNVLFCLPYAADLRAIVIKPYVGRHRVTQLNVFMLGDTLTDGGCSTSVANKVLRVCENLKPLVSINLEAYTTQTVIAVRLHPDTLIPANSCAHSAACLYELDASRHSNPHRKKRYVLLRLCKTFDATCVPCLGAVELWCAELPDFKVDTSSSAWKTPYSLDSTEFVSNNTLPAASDDAIKVAPGKFIDSLTGELMQEPVRLPSGTYVDRSSLMRFWQQRRTMQPDLTPVDPFTMLPLDETQLICDQQLKESISTYRSKWERLDRLCNQLDRVETTVRLTKILPVQESNSDEEESSDDNRDFDASTCNNL